MHSNAVDITGRQFARLEVLRESKTRNKKREVCWICLCSCGAYIVVSGCSLRSGNTKSCGCLHHDMLHLNLGEANLNKLYATYVSSAKKRKIKFDLTKKEFKDLTKQNCKYCGTEPLTAKTSSRSYGEYIYNGIDGIDRVDNNIGYTLDNCVACCKMCNYMKHSSSVGDFSSHVRKIYEHLFKR